MQAISLCHNYFFSNFVLKPQNFGQEGGKFQKFEYLKKIAF